MKKKKLGYMHWLPGFLLSFLLKAILYALANRPLMYALSGFAPVVRVNLAVVAVLVMFFLVDLFWYLFTFRRYYDSTVYIGFCIIRILYHLVDVIGSLLKNYGFMYSQDQVFWFGLLSLATNILPFVFFFKRSLREAAEAEAEAPSEESVQ